MQFEKYAKRIDYLNELIRKESTGTPNNLAVKLGISRRMVFNYLDFINDATGGIYYCKKNKTYRFKA